MVFPLRGANGEYRPFLTRIQPYYDAQGSLTYWFGNNVDITAQRSAEKALNDMNAELERRVQDEVQKREKAQQQLAQAEKLTALGQLAGGMAHDFNNVIQAISSYANVLARSPNSSDEVRLLVEKIKEVSQRGAGVARRLLAFARRDELRSEPVDIKLLLMGVHELLSHIIKSSISLHLDLAEFLPPVLADKGQLETALINIAANAQDAISTDGAIILSAAQETVFDCHPAGLAPGDYVCIGVADTGIGMDEATLARATEPFFTTKAPDKGTGMGLSMARGFAEQSGGALAISSEPACGTKVTIWLPVSKLSVASIERETVHILGGPRRVLLVDDDQAVREALAQELAGLGYRLIQAEDGVAALALLDGGEPVDLVVSDLSMPGMNGLALVQAAQERRPSLPAIILTGYAGEAQALGFGLVNSGRTFGVLRKPVTGIELGTQIEAMLTAKKMTLR